MNYHVKNEQSYNLLVKTLYGLGYRLSGCTSLAETREIMQFSSYPVLSTSVDDRVLGGYRTPNGLTLATDAELGELLVQSLSVARKLKNIRGYAVSLTGKTLVVGCQTFDLKNVKELIAAVRKA